MAAFDWDDVRIFLAAARAGSLTSAAQRLSLDPATVGRRLNRLETSLKSTLVIRSASGLECTATGARLLELAALAEQAMAEVEDAASSDPVGGTIRLSVAEGFGGVLVAPALKDLRRRHRNLRLELAANAGFLSLSRRQVDIAVTLSAPNDSRLAVAPLATYQLALYASPAYIEQNGEPTSIEDLFDVELIGYVDDLIYAPQLRYLEELDKRLRPTMSSSSIRAQREIIASDGGVGILPCFMAEGLVRLMQTQVLITRQFWVGTHGDTAGGARARAVLKWLTEIVATNAGRLRPY